MSATFPQRIPQLIAGLLGATGVALGALGAHRLQPLLVERGMLHSWETGSKYHLVHAVALLVVALLVREGGRSAALRWAFWSWTAGIVLFSGSLYWFALGGPRPLVYVTPIGGIALMAGWLLVLVGACGQTQDL